MKGFFGKFVFFKRPTDDYASGIVVELWGGRFYNENYLQVFLLSISLILNAYFLFFV
jgi:hypothetical protein